MFYDRYKQLCEQRGRSLSAVATAAGMSRANVTGWKDGAVPSIETIQRLAGALEVPASALLEEADSANTPSWLVKEQEKWRRFELTTSNAAQVYALNSLLDRLNLSRFELALLLTSLRVRPEFGLEDFDMSVHE